ncbi:MAG: GNAT family N-acetyltransferase [Pseudomonadales bacterium]|nr:GNAT family N-acetyltransferase [Pseudomonadales bacterium]
MGNIELQIQLDDLTGTEIAEFLEEHISDMKSVSPPESKHALDLEGLKSPDITFWSFYADERLVGCGALKELDASNGEIKSMRTSPVFRGAGVGAFILSHILEESKNRSYRKVNLETGSMHFFEPARKLYERFGFVTCEPFANYQKDANSVFYAKVLGSE